jgi:hypothetical protein
LLKPHPRAQFSSLDGLTSGLVATCGFDPFGLHSKLDATRHARYVAQEQRDSTQNRISELRSQEQMLENHLNESRELGVELQRLGGTANTAQSHSIDLQSRFSPVKDGASKLVLSLEKVVGGMGVIGSLVDSTEKEFGELLLQLCRDTLADIQKVNDELVERYGVTVPGIQEVRDELENI